MHLSVFVCIRVIIQTAPFFILKKKFNIFIHHAFYFHNLNILHCLGQLNILHLIFIQLYFQM